MKTFSQFIIEKKGDNPDIDLNLRRGRIERKQGRELNPKEVERLKKGAGNGSIGGKETDFRSSSKSGAEKFNRGQQNVDKIIKGAEDTKNISGDLARREATKAGAGSKSTPQQLKRQKGFLDRVFKNLEKGTDNLTKRLTGRFSRPATRKGQRPQEVRGRSGKPFSAVKKDIDAKNPTRTSSVTGGKLPTGDGRKNNKGSGSTWKKKGEWKTGANPSGKPEVSKPKAVKQSEVSKKATEYTQKYNTSQYKEPVTPKYSRSQKSALTGKANKIIDDLRGKSPGAKLSARMSKAVDSSTKPGTYSDKVNQALKYKKPTPAPKSTVIKPETFKSTKKASVSSTAKKPLLDPVKWKSDTSAQIKAQAAKASKAREIKLSQPSDFKPKPKPTSTSIPKTKTSAFTKGLEKSKSITPEVVTKTPFDKVTNTATKKLVKDTTKSVGKQTFKQFAKKALTGVGRVANPIATAAFTVDDLATGYKSERAKGASKGRSVAKGVTKAGSYLGGAAAGGKLGSMIGTAVLPGVGTLVGGALGAVAGGLTASSVANKTFDKVAGKTALQKQMEKNKVRRKKLTGTSTKSSGVPGGYWKGMNPGLRGGGVNISAN